MSDDVRAEIRELCAQVDGIEAKHRIGLLMAENERLRWALEACDHLAVIAQMALKEVEE